MVSIPAKVEELVKKPGTVKALVTSSKAGRPHAIVAGSINMTGPGEIIMGEILTKVSAANLKENSCAAFLFANGLEAYEVKAVFKARLDKGPALDGMNEALKAMKLKASAVLVFEVKAVYDQSASPNAGAKIA